MVRSSGGFHVRSRGTAVTMADNSSSGAAGKQQQQLKTRPATAAEPLQRKKTASAVDVAIAMLEAAQAGPPVSKRKRGDEDTGPTEGTEQQYAGEYQDRKRHLDDRDGHIIPVLGTNLTERCTATALP